MNLFTEIKKNFTTKEIADFYGTRPSRNGLAPYPFHRDRTPSLKLDTRFHCFGRGADEDAVDFVSRLVSLPVREAAEKIARDFGIDYDPEDLGPLGQPRDGPPLTDVDLKYLILYCEETYGLSAEKKIENAVAVIANENRFHPIRDYLEQLQWDGQERIRNCLHHFLGADTDKSFGDVTLAFGLLQVLLLNTKMFMYTKVNLACTSFSFIGVQECNAA